MAWCDDRYTVTIDSCFDLFKSSISPFHTLCEKLEPYIIIHTMDEHWNRDTYIPKVPMRRLACNVNVLGLLD